MNRITAVLFHSDQKWHPVLAFFGDAWLVGTDMPTDGYAKDLAWIHSEDIEAVVYE